MCGIDPDLSINQNYELLLRKRRLIEIKTINGDVWCTNCRKLAKDHLPDNRCSTYATGTSFHSEYDEELSQIVECLEHIECLL